jgi:hypothetical protein
VQIPRVHFPLSEPENFARALIETKGAEFIYLAALAEITALSFDPPPNPAGSAMAGYHFALLIGNYHARLNH